MSSQTIIMDPAKTKPSMLHFSEAHFEKNLTALKNTQESIQTLSSWCLQHKQHHKKIVNCWFKVIKKVKIESRLTLFYLANDVIQYSKRKNLEFVHTWALVLQRAVTLVRDDKIKPNILRIFKIWMDRGIFDEAFIADLTGLLESPKGVSSDTAKLIAEFQPMKLIDKVRSCKVLEDDTDLKLSNLKESPLELTDIDALRNNLKDRRHGADLVSEVDDGLARMEAYVTALREEIKDRGKLIDLLEQGSVFYEHQKGEAKIVVNCCREGLCTSTAASWHRVGGLRLYSGSSMQRTASSVPASSRACTAAFSTTQLSKAYRNFGSRVKNLKRKLDELLPSLPSPVPSPDIDAPSPTPSDTELELPGDPSHGMAPSEFDMMVPDSHPVHMFMQASEHSASLSGMGSFMGSGPLPFDLQGNLFQDQDAQVKSGDDGSSSEGKPIEVIGGSRSSKPDEGFNINDFLKSLSHPESVEPPTPAIPGLEAAPVSTIPLPVLTDTKQPTSQYSLDSFNASLYSVFANPPPPPPSNNMVSPSNSLQPPPVPPDMFMQDQSQWSGYEDMMLDQNNDWNTKLPTKFPTWNPDLEQGWESESMEESTKWEMGTPNKVPKIDETPMSPPMFEKEGFNEPVEYDDRSGAVAEDVDHRNVLIQHTRAGKKDIDHRNLISLTGSPASHQKTRQPTTDWTKFDTVSKDLDFRVLTNPVAARKTVVGDQDMRQSIPVAISVPQTPSSPNPNDSTAAVPFTDNVESVDMEMSDEELDSGNSQDSKSNQSNGKRSNNGMNQAYNEKLINRGVHQQKNMNQPSRMTNHSNGPQKTQSSTTATHVAGQRPPVSPIKPLLPSLVTGPLIKSPAATHPAKPNVQSPKTPLLASPLNPVQSTSTIKPLLQTLTPTSVTPKVQETSLSNEKAEKAIQGDSEENGDESWTSHGEWNSPSNQLFAERMRASDAFDDDHHNHSSNHRARAQGGPRTRGRRGNHMGSSNNFVSTRGKPQQSEFQPRGGANHFPGTPPGFPNRGFRGAYRPFRAGRRGHFNRW